MNLITDKVDNAATQGLIPKVIAKLAGDPELYHVFTALHAGPSYPDPAPQLPSPLRSGSPKPLSPLTFKDDFDVCLIEHICTMNAFATRDITSKDHPHDAACIYSLPSLFNHSCIASATWHHIGDAMIFRAAKSLREGEELTIPYVAGTSHLTKHPQLAKHMDQCDCEECDADRHDGDASCMRRDHLLSRIKCFPDMGFCAPAKNVREILHELERTYSPDRGTYRPGVSLIQHMLADAISVQALRRPDLWPQVLIEEFKSLEAAGVQVVDKTISFPSDKVSGQKSAGQGQGNGSSEDKGQDERDDPGAPLPLPIGTDSVPTHAARHCVSVMIRIASVFFKRGNLNMAGRWIKAARWRAYTCSSRSSSRYITDANHFSSGRCAHRWRMGTV